MQSLKIMKRIQRLVRRGKFGAALSLAKSQIPILPADAAAQMRELVAALSLTAGKGADVADLLANADESVDVLLMRAQAAIRLGDFDSAMADCTRANELDPGSLGVVATILEGEGVANAAGRSFGNCSADDSLINDALLRVKALRTAPRQFDPKLLPKKLARARG